MKWCERRGATSLCVREELSRRQVQTLAALPSQGVLNLVVACPAFVADNLETLEEIGLAGRETFLEAGGESFTLVPCLNDRADWVAALSGWCQEALNDRPMPN